MAKNDNLKDFLTDVADAIREKKGTEDLINPQDFSDEIRNLPSGGEVVEEKDVNFYDYDGTLLFSYTIAEAQSLTELPTPKGHEGLVFQGWNWDYEDVIALDYPMDIGAIYITDDGKTRFYLEVEDEDGVDIELRFKQDIANSVIVDFGDGSDAITFEELTINAPHHYAKGSYILTTQAVGNAVVYFNNTDAYHNIFGNIADKSSDILIKVEFGERTNVGSYAFSGCAKLRYITLNYYREIGWTDTFYNCISLECVIYPKGQQYIFGTTFQNSPSLKLLCIPKTLKNCNSSLNGCISLRKFRVFDGFNLGYFVNVGFESFRIPNPTNTIANFKQCARLKKLENLEIVNSHTGGYLISECKSIEKIVIPQTWTTIQAHEFYYCSALKEIVLPSHIESIAVYAFNGCACKIIDFSKSDIVPTLASTNVFTKSNPDFRIVVPDALYDEWISATNWSTYADRIIKASEYGN